MKKRTVVMSEDAILGELNKILVDIHDFNESSQKPSKSVRDFIQKPPVKNLAVAEDLISRLEHLIAPQLRNKLDLKSIEKALMVNGTESRKICDKVSRVIKEENIFSRFCKVMDQINAVRRK